MTEARDRMRKHSESHVFGTPTARKSNIRESDSYRSSVFAPPERKAARFNPHRPTDHQSADFYDVSTTAPSEKLQTVAQFQPSYKYEQQRLAAKPPPRSFTPQPKRTYEPVLKDFNSKKLLEKAVERRKDLPRAVTPVETLKSEVGNEENFPRSRAESERNFVDWFGRPRPNAAIRREKTPTAASWKDARFEDKSTRPLENYSPAAFRDQQLRSSLDPPSPVVSRPQHHVHTPSGPSNPKQMRLFNLNQVEIQDLPRPEEARLDAFLIKGLHANADVLSVRSLCQGLHIVSVEPELDDIQGKCRGQAKVVLRHFPGEDTVARLVDQVKDAGLDIQKHRPDLGRKNNYTDLAGRTFLDHQLQLEERRFGEDLQNPRLSKQRLLGSAADLFGSSAALKQFHGQVGKAGESGDKEFRQWETVKKGRSQTPGTSGKVQADKGFLRPTESWKNKAK